MKSGLRISGEELTDLSSAYFGVLEVTFENSTADWIRVERVGLDFGSPAKNAAVTVPAGENLEAFIASTEQRNAVRRVNRQTAFALTALGGTLVGGSSSDQGVALAGDTAAVASLGALAVDSHAQSIATAEQVARLPATHLLASGFTIPPGLFVKRWVVLQTKAASPSECISSVMLGYQLGATASERVLLTFKERQSDSEWQAATCHPPEPHPERHY
jgi:hypothetical protein